VVESKSVAIVTGASQGIGRAAAIRLARDFSAVVLAARQEDELRNTGAQVQSAGAQPLIFALDLREPRSAEILVHGTLDRPEIYWWLLSQCGMPAEQERYLFPNSRCRRAS